MSLGASPSSTTRLTASMRRCSKALWLSVRPSIFAMPLTLSPQIRRVQQNVAYPTDLSVMGFGKEVELKIEGTRVSVRDFGRGIPLGKVVDCVSTINTGAKYNDDVFQFS